ncbi:MAG: hypothetical protein WKF89_01970 [Chitinophagaceae bacterium]
MSKIQKIETILSLAANKPHHVIQPRPELTFVRCGQMFRCKKTGALLSEEEITAKYRSKFRKVQGLPRITGFDVMSTGDNGELITIEIVLLAIDKTEVVFDG